MSMDDGSSNQIETMLRSHVEALLREIWGHTELVVDADGDYPFRSDTTACWVRVVGGDEPAVQVFAHAAVDVPRSVKMLAEVNDVNRRARWCKLFWVNGFVMSDATLHWTAVDRPALERLMGATVAMCDDVGPMFAAVFGGTTPLEPQSAPADDDQDAA